MSPFLLLNRLDEWNTGSVQMVAAAAAAALKGLGDTA